VILLLILLSWAVALYRHLSGLDGFPTRVDSLQIAALAVIAYAVEQLLRAAQQDYRGFDDGLTGYLIHESYYSLIWRFASAIAIIVGTACLIILVKAFLRAMVKGFPPLLPIALLVNLPLGVVGVFWYSTAFRYLMPRAETALRWSFVRPILYLRSFAADASFMEKETRVLLPAAFMPGQLADTDERSLAEALGDIGPLVAIGKPRERLPPLGAARLYVRDPEEWKKVVEKLVEMSSLIILKAGTTDGFLWELEHVVKHCDPGKVVIYVPKHVRGSTYTKFQNFAGQCLPYTLPHKLGDVAFIGFRPDWSPITYPVRTSFLGAIRFVFGFKKAPRLRRALGSTLKNLQLGSRQLPFLPREWLALCAYIWMCMDSYSSFVDRLR